MTFIRLTSHVSHDYPLSVYARPERLDLIMEQRSGSLIFVLGDQKGALVKELPEEIIAKIESAKDGSRVPPA